MNKLLLIMIMKDNKTFQENTEILNKFLEKNKHKNTPTSREKYGKHNPRRIRFNQHKQVFNKQKRVYSQLKKEQKENKKQTEIKIKEKYTKKCKPPLPKKIQPTTKKQDKKNTATNSNRKLSLPKKPISLRQTIVNSDKTNLYKDGTIPIKMLLIGDSMIGKTSMIVSYTTNNFPTQYEPTVFQNYVADLVCNQQKVKLFLWDISGQQQYAQFKQISYKKADLILICFSMIDEQSFHHTLKKWLPESEKQCPSAYKMIVGNKADLHHEYSIDQKHNPKPLRISKMEKQCRIRGYQFFSCSALTQKGLNEMFSFAMNKVIHKINTKKQSQQNCKIF